MPYVVYVNIPNNKAIVHDTSCGKYQARKRNCTHNGFWARPFSNFATAWRFAASTRKKTVDTCAFCCEPFAPQGNRKSAMFKSHEDTVKLAHSFASIYNLLQSKGDFKLATAVGTRFAARAELGQQGEHVRERVIPFFQRGTEFGRAYSCCWGHYYNCNRTRIGMYCEALDLAMKFSITLE